MLYLNKSKDYFLDYIKNEKIRIDKFIKNKSKCTNAKQVNRCNLILLNFYKNIIYCMCYIGLKDDGFKSTVNSYLSLLDSVKKLVPESEIIDGLAIKYLFVNSSDESYELFFNKLEQMSNYDIYKDFYEIIKNGNICFDLKNFMNNKWYSKCVNYAWYDSHLNDNDTYVGYLSFIASVIAKKYGLDTSKIKFVI